MPWYNRGPLRLHYVVQGPAAGPLVLLLHGVQGCAALWESVAQGLATRGWLAVAPDLRGHGESDRAVDYGLRAYVGDAVALIEHLGAAPVALVGHSLGGRIAWETAAARPDLVQRLVIEDQHPDARPESMPYWEQWAAEWPAHFADREAGLAYLRAQERNPAWWGPSLVPLPGGGWGWAMDIPGVVATARSLTGESGWESLARVQAPTLLIRGGRSEHLTAEVAARMVAVLPQGRLLTVPAQGHWVHRDPEPYVSVVADFLSAAGH